MTLTDDVLGADRSRHWAEIIGTDGATVVIHAARQANIVALKME